jgi:predicted phage tail protein
MQHNLKKHMDIVQVQMEKFKQTMNAETLNKREVKTAMQNVWNVWSDMKFEMAEYLPREKITR